MGLLDSLLGNAQHQQDYQQDVQRYQQGAPHQGYSDQEVVQRYPGGNPRAHEDPRYLAEQTTELHEQQPGTLTQLLGGGSGGGNAL